MCDRYNLYVEIVIKRGNGRIFCVFEKEGERGNFEELEERGRREVFLSGMNLSICKGRVGEILLWGSC